MEDIASRKSINNQQHAFISADGTKYLWEERQETNTNISLTGDEIEGLRQHIKETTDEVLQNAESGNGKVMGVKIPLKEERLHFITNIIISVLKFKSELEIKLTEHATERLTEDVLNGIDHPKSRGWLSNEDVNECVFTINAVNSARLTIVKSTLSKSEVKFNPRIALEVTGKKVNGVEGILALAFVEEKKIRIITLL